MTQPEEAQLPPELARLPRGRHGLPREFVEQNQRTRLIGGIIDSVTEHGYAGATIESIVKDAGVSRGVFYQHFANKEDGFRVAYDTAMAEVRNRFERGFETGEDWPASVGGGLRAMLAFFAANPHIARVTMVEAMFATAELAEHHHEQIELLAPYLEQGRSKADDAGDDEVAEAGEADAPSPVTKKVVLGGIFSLISRRVLAGETESLPELGPELTGFATAVYRSDAPSPVAGLASA